MAFTKGKQINRVLAGYIRMSGITAQGIDDDITVDITAILLAAGYNANPVNLVVSPSVKLPGIVTNVGLNRSELFDNGTGEKLTDDSREVYGRITEAAGVYTISYFSLDSGVETPHTFIAPTTIDVEFIYRFAFGDLPTDIFVGLTQRNVRQDAGGAGGGRDYNEELIVTAVDTITDLLFTPDVIANVQLQVNGKVHDPIGASPTFSVSGKVLTWNALNAGYALATTDRVVASYTTLEE